MSIGLKPLSDYVSALEKNLATGKATEPSHYPALKVLMESIGEGITALNEPRRIECGAPDFVISKGSATVGYVEAKDIGKSLDKEEQTEQLRRYLGALTNLILTDYLEFRWYVDSERRLSARLGTLAKDGRIRRDKAGTQAMAELLTGFLAHKAEAVGTPRELALRMARLAHLVRDLIVAAFEKEPKSGTLHAQFSAFRDNLIPDLSAEQFADMYAQTIAYGLFAARCTNSGGKGFARQNAAYLLPKTNPFLRKLFNHIAGPDLDDRIAWLVDDLAEVLAQADMASILQDFGKRTAKEDPVVHFYETFLAAYDPKVREMRGVYYTPEPVVSYIVRSIDYLLKTRFHKPQGLGDAGVLILDPAVGTATFLYTVVKQVYESLVGQGQRGLWNDYVAEKLLPRLFGFELLMAPYAVAHLKLGLLLQETGYKFGSEQRLGIYLTNTLEEAIKRSEALFAAWITEEANAAAEIKKELPIMVVLGNPPYSVSSLNRGEWIDALLEDYKRGLHEKKLNIDDDYIKFVRFAQWRIEQTGYGILGFITNNSYLDGLTHRRMRECLLESFSDVYILNLHGSSRRGEKAPENIKDENVFDIQQGVTIGIFMKEPAKSVSPRVRYADMWGPRAKKYLELSESDIANTSWCELSPKPPHFFFVPKDFSLEEEYSQWWSIRDIFMVSQNGLKTDRDELFFDFDRHTLEERMHIFFGKKYGDDFKQQYRIFPSSSFDIEARREQTAFDREHIKPCLYRPFDVRYLYYDPNLTSRPAYKVMRHMQKGNIALIATRQFGGHQHFILLSTNKLTEISSQAYAPYTLFPLYLYPSEGEMQGKLEAEEARRPNLNPFFVADLCGKLGRPLPSWSGGQALGGQGEQARVPVLPAEESPVEQKPEGQRPVGRTPSPAPHPEQARVPVLPAEESPVEQKPVGQKPVGQTPVGRTPSPAPHPEQARVPVLPVEQPPVEQPPPAVHGPDLAITRRHLPHWQLGGSTYFVTFRVREGITLSPEERGMVLQSCLYGHPKSWRLHVAIVMADHVHLLLTPAEVQPNRWVSLSQIMQGIKGATAHRINEHRGWQGPLWQDESFDRIIRDEAEFTSKWKYICENAAKAGLDEDGLGYPFFWWEGKEEREISPEDIFNYAYAVFHSPTYRRRYAEFLKIDFPRLPLTSDRALFKALAQKGAELVALHLMESPALNNLVTKYPVPGSNVVERVTYNEPQRRVYINKSQYFEGIPPEVWNCPIGGYQVCQKWLKDRKGRKLSIDEAEHYQKMIVALKETIRLMAEIDELIPCWPME